MDGIAHIQFDSFGPYELAAGSEYRYTVLSRGEVKLVCETKVLFWRDKFGRTSKVLWDDNKFIGWPLKNVLLAIDLKRTVVELGLIDD